MLLTLNELIEFVLLKVKTLMEQEESEIDFYYIMVYFFKENVFRIF